MSVVVAGFVISHESELTFGCFGENVGVELESVEIGHNTIVGACSLVNRDLPGYVIAFGVPSRIQKKIR